MEKGRLTRRKFLAQSAVLAAPAARGATGTLKVVCVGAHPDDPESGCAGTLARYADLGHSVTVLYLTRGERGIRDKGLDEAAKIRSAENEKACQTLKAKPLFFGQVDGDTRVDRAQVEAMTTLLTTENADVLLAHWPVDTHMDHQVASLLTTRACMNLQKQPQLYFFEVNTGSQSQGFLPNTYVDVSPVLEKKKLALLAHVSQDGQEIWTEHHEIIARWRGREAGVLAAEAFVHVNGDRRISSLPAI